MSMNKGSVTIDSETGEASGSGAAKEIFDDWDAKIDYQGVTGTTLATARQQLADMCNSFALIIDHIKNNAEVSTTVEDISSGSETAEGSGTIS